MQQIRSTAETSRLFLLKMYTHKFSRPHSLTLRNYAPSQPIKEQNNDSSRSQVGHTHICQDPSLQHPNFKTALQYCKIQASPASFAHTWNFGVVFVFALRQKTLPLHPRPCRTNITLCILIQQMGVGCPTLSKSPVST